MIRKYKFTYQRRIKSIVGVILLALWLVILVAFSSLGFIIAPFYAVSKWGLAIPTELIFCLSMVGIFILSALIAVAMIFLESRGE